MSEVYEFSLQGVRGFKDTQKLSLHLDISDEGVECILPLWEDYTGKVLEIPKTGIVTLTIREDNIIISGKELELASLLSSHAQWVALDQKGQLLLTVQLREQTSSISLSDEQGYCQNLARTNAALRGKVLDLEKALNHYKKGFQKHVSYTKHMQHDESATVKLLVDKLKHQSSHYRIIKTDLENKIETSHTLCLQEKVNKEKAEEECSRIKNELEMLRVKAQQDLNAVASTKDIEISDLKRRIEDTQKTIFELTAENSSIKEKFIAKESSQQEYILEKLEESESHRKLLLRQLENAKPNEELGEIIKQGESWAFQSLNEECKGLKHEIQMQKQKICSLENQLEQSKVEALNAHSDYSRQLKKFKSKLDTLKHESERKIQEKDEEIFRLNERIKSLLLEIERLKNQLSFSRAELEETKNSHKEKLLELSQLYSDQKDSLYQDYKQSLDSFKQKYAEKEGELEGSRKLVHELRDAVQDLQIKDAETTIQSLSSEIQTQKQEITQLNLDLKKKEVTVESLQQHIKLKDDLIAESQDTNDTLSSKNYDLQLKLEQTKQALYEEQQKSRQTELSYEKLRQNLDSKDKSYSLSEHLIEKLKKDLSDEQEKTRETELNIEKLRCEMTQMQNQTNKAELAANELQKSLHLKDLEEIRTLGTIDQLKKMIESKENTIKQMESNIKEIKQSALDESHRNVQAEQLLNQLKQEALENNNERESLQQAVQELTSNLKHIEENLISKDETIKHLQENEIALKKKLEETERIIRDGFKKEKKLHKQLKKERMRLDLMVKEQQERANRRPMTADERFKEYLKTYGLEKQFVKVSEGVYTFGSKKVSVSLKNGYLVCRVGGGYMMIDEFIKLFMEQNDSKSNSPEKKPRKEPEVLEPLVSSFESPVKDIRIVTPKDSGKPFK